MKTDLSLSIPKPCDAQWENFTPTQNGGYCGSCFKTVVDFTKMDDTTIVEFFKAKPTPTCGRFRNDQLKAYTLSGPTNITPGLTLLKTGALSLLLAFVSKPSSAQTRNEKVKTENIRHSEQQADKTQIQPSEKIISGIVSSTEDGSPLPGVNIVLKGTKTGTVTDADGAYKFPIALKEGDVLVFAFIGLESQELTISRKIIEDMSLPIAMEMCQYVTMGEVLVTGVYGEPKRGLSRWWSKVKSVF